MTDERPDGWIEPTVEAPEGDDDDAAADDDETSAPAPAQEPEPLTEAKAEAIMKALEREATRHAREVEKRAGPMFVDLSPCPACNGWPGTPGYIVREIGEPGMTLRRQDVLTNLGGTGAPEYPVDAERVRCDVCDGYGMLSTGSRVENQAALPCRACTGQGWRQKLTPVEAPTVVAPIANTSTGGATHYAPTTPTDAWGRPLGHPHFNIAPAEVGA